MKGGFVMQCISKMDTGLHGLHVLLLIRMLFKITFFGNCIEIILLNVFISNILSCLVALKEICQTVVEYRIVPSSCSNFMTLNSISKIL